MTVIRRARNELSTKVLQFARGKTSFGTREIAMRLDITPAHASVLLSGMAADGRLKRLSRGQYAPMFMPITQEQERSVGAQIEQDLRSRLESMMNELIDLEPEDRVLDFMLKTTAWNLERAIEWIDAPSVRIEMRTGPVTRKPIG